MHFVICSVASVHMEITEQNKASRIFCHLRYWEQSEDGLEPIPGGASCSPFLCKALNLSGTRCDEQQESSAKPWELCFKDRKSFPLHNLQ